MRSSTFAHFTLFAILTLTAACKKTGPTVSYTQVDPATAASITGTIHLTGQAPARVEIDMAQDPACSLDLSGSGKNMTEQYVVKDGQLANVFVYIKDGLGGKVYPIPRVPVKIDQRGCRFTPHVAGAMVGQQVQFTNSDATMHNVHMVPNVGGNESFDVSQGPNSGPDSRQFHAPELMIPLRCNNHPWMQAYLNVVANPFFAVSDADGHYIIRGLPPGTYTLVADQEQLGQQTATVSLTSKQAATKDFTYSSKAGVNAH